MCLSNLHPTSLLQLRCLCSHASTRCSSATPRQAYSRNEEFLVRVPVREQNMRLWDISGGLLYALEQGTEPPPKLSGRVIVAVEHFYPSPAQIQYERNFDSALKNSQENPWKTLTECCSAILKCHNPLINDCGVDVDNRMVAASWMSRSQKCHSAWERKPISGNQNTKLLKDIKGAIWNWLLTG